jgi:hypothetical protein
MLLFALLRKRTGCLSFRLQAVFGTTGRSPKTACRRNDKRVTRPFI